MEIFYGLSFFLLVVFSSFILISIVKKMKQQVYEHFQVTELVKYKKIRRNWLIILIFSLVIIIYTSYYPTLTLLVILAWSVSFLALLILAHSQDRINLINRSKNVLKIQLENVHNFNLQSLAGELEYPYSDLKMATKYLKNKGEISKEFY